MKIKKTLNNYYKEEMEKIEIRISPDMFLANNKRDNRHIRSQNIVFNFAFAAVLLLFVFLSNIYVSPFASDIALYSQENKMDVLCDSKIREFISFIDESKIFHNN